MNGEISISTLIEYNESLQIKFESINNYLQSNLIDLDSFTSYLDRLNDYLSFYSLINDEAKVPMRIDVCLSNRSDLCWHIEDSINIIIIDQKVPNQQTSVAPFDWFTSAAYQLNNMNLDQLNLHSLNSLNSVVLFILERLGFFCFLVAENKFSLS